MLKHGVLMDVRKLEDFCRYNFGDVTFLEAYERTGRVINVTVGRFVLGDQVCSRCDFFFHFCVCDLV